MTLPLIHGTVDLQMPARIVYGRPAAAALRDEMDRFVAANEGLSSRFPKRIDFPSYSPSELISIAAVMMAVFGQRAFTAILESLNSSDMPSTHMLMPYLAIV